MKLDKLINKEIFSIIEKFDKLKQTKETTKWQKKEVIL